MQWLPRPKVTTAVLLATAPDQHGEAAATLGWQRRHRGRAAAGTTRRAGRPLGPGSSPGRGGSSPCGGRSRASPPHASCTYRATSGATSERSRRSRPRSPGDLLVAAADVVTHREALAGAAAGLAGRDRGALRHGGGRERAVAGGAGPTWPLGQRGVRASLRQPAECELSRPGQGRGGGPAGARRSGNPAGIAAGSSNGERRRARPRRAGALRCRRRRSPAARAVLGAAGVPAGGRARRRRDQRSRRGPPAARFGRQGRRQLLHDLPRQPMVEARRALGRAARVDAESGHDGVARHRRARGDRVRDRRACRPDRGRAAAAAVVRDRLRGRATGPLHAHVLPPRRVARRHLRPHQGVRGLRGPRDRRERLRRPRLDPGRRGAGAADRPPRGRLLVRDPPARAARRGPATAARRTG